ncbi:MAG: hypothetical protein HUJ85_06990, partial [Veillonella sp.]|nr:hypothetical protein [Veillonella sp.]
GQKCTLPDGEKHPGCLLEKALNTRRVQWKQMPAKDNGQIPVSYWIPVPNHEDYYIHFATGLYKDYSQPNE